MEDSLEEVHEELLAWAESIGVKINGIRPMRLSGRGFGIVATDHIPPDTEILTVPISALRTKDTVAPALTKRLPLSSPSTSTSKDQTFTVHGLLAADLALNTSANTAKFAKWAAVVPTWADLQLVMPLVWPACLQALLPTSAAKLLAEQRSKFERDWAVVSAAFPFPTRVSRRGSTSNGDDGGNAEDDSTTPSTPTTNGGSIFQDIAPTCTKEEYLYAWLLVNTRTFYFVTPQTKKLPKADHMALQPVADLFNHTDRDGCAVVFGPTTTYSFRTTRAYEKGDEVHISYGSHANDFLLVEYGFVLGDDGSSSSTSAAEASTPDANQTPNQNQWDEVRIDDAILPILTRAQQEDLEDDRFLGNYILDRETVCHRTQVALRRILVDKPAHKGGITMNTWRQFVNGLDDGERSQRAADNQLVLLLEEWDDQVIELRMEEMEELEKCQYHAGEDDNAGDIDGLDLPEEKKVNDMRKEMLKKRWLQIRNLVHETMRRLK